MRTEKEMMDLIIRIDLTFAAIEKVDTIIENDRVGVTLLDKDGLTGVI